MAQLPETSSYGLFDTAFTANAYAEIVRANQEQAAAGLRQFFDTYNVEAMVTNFGQPDAAAGYAAITVPNGVNADGQRTGLGFVGDFLGDRS